MIKIEDPKFGFELCDLCQDGTKADKAIRFTDKRGSTTTVRTCFECLEQLKEQVEKYV